MSDLLKVGAMIVVAVAVGAGIKHFRGDANAMPSQAEVNEQASKMMASMEEEAVRKYPNLPRSEALARYAREHAGQQLSGKTGDDRDASAAQMFYGFYYMNTRSREAWCRQRGADLSTWVATFNRTYAREKAAADAIFARAGRQPEQMVTMVTDSLSEYVDKDMRDIATSANAPLDQVCPMLNQNAEQLAPMLQLPPGVRDTLLQAG
jgi:hypothetical protein